MCNVCVLLCCPWDSHCWPGNHLKSPAERPLRGPVLWCWRPIRTIQLVPPLLCLFLSLIVSFGLIILILLIENKVSSSISIIISFLISYFTHLLTWLWPPSVYSSIGDFSEVQSSPQNIPAPNCPVTCLHLHVTFLTQLRHTPVNIFLRLPGAPAAHPCLLDAICSFLKLGFIF